LPKRNVSQPKLDGQGILVWLLKQAMTQRVKNLNLEIIYRLAQ